MWINSTTNEWSEEKPIRVRLPNGLTATGELITDQMLVDLGWAWQEIEEFIPEIDEINTGTNTTVGD
jgi:hypothetical protein